MTQKPGMNAPHYYQREQALVFDNVSDMSFGRVFTKYRMTFVEFHSLSIVFMKTKVVAFLLFHNALEVFSKVKLDK